jgi:tetratricopeptide (TPR) repeat protein
MRRAALSIAIAAALAAGCAAHPEKRTLAELHAIEPDVAEVPVTEGLEQAMQGYRRFLDETPETELTPEAMRRLADLQIEQQFGIHAGDGAMREMAAPERADIVGDAAAPRVPAAAAGGLAESEQDFEARASAASPLPSPARAAPADPSAALQAIALYDRLLTEYPAYEHNDQVLYQKARAYDELGRTEEAMETMQSLIAANPHSAHYDEIQFRRGEYFFTRRKFGDAEPAYSAVIGLGPDSSYYEFALYKLGWTLYKQEFYDEAQRRFMALLDYKVSTGYDFDQKHEEDEERRVADTFRVISLGFSNLGGPDVVREYFAENGRRDYENRIYANLGEFYLAKLRYDDAAKTYKAFVALNPFHRSSPHFGMRVIEIYAEGKFPKLVLEAKKEFAATYGRSPPRC